MKELTGFVKGINFGGWLSQYSYDRDHLDSYITEQDFKTVSAWGLDHVRIPVDYNVFEDAEGTPTDLGFEYLDKAAAWGEKYGVNIIIDLHKTYGYSYEVLYGESGFFQSEKLQERFFKLWERIAARYGSKRDTVAFELLNEVNDKELSDTWNRIIRTAIERIRKLAPGNIILVGGYWNNSIDALHDLDLPYDDRVAYNFHCYDPFLFTHQAAYWVPQMNESFRISYPGDINEYRIKVKELDLTHIQDYTDIPDSGFDASYFEGRFRNAVKLCEERGCALYCGEYGAIGLAAPEDILRWYKDINAAFVKFGIARGAWAYKKVDFGITEEKMNGVLPELVRYL